MGQSGFTLCLRGGERVGACALTEVDEHLAVALPHVLRHGEDAGHVVVQEGVLLLCR